MRLFYTPSSPYARKVRIVAILLDLKSLELVLSNPMTDTALRRVNPLGKVPALEDGELALLESGLICEYLLDHYNPRGGDYLKKGTPYYYQVQSVHFLAQGILDAALATVMELRRSDSERSNFWLERWRMAIIHAVQSVPVDALGDADQVHMGTIAMVCAVGYLDFRLPQLAWRQSNSELGHWYAGLEELDWVRQTAPRDA